MAACTSKSPSGQIDSMQKRLTKAESQLEVLYNEDFSNLVSKCQVLDSTLTVTAENFEAYELITMYLQQFETMHPIMQEDIKFSREQLTNLKDDYVSGVLPEEKVVKYIADEEAALHKTEAQLKYFQEKFDEQEKIAKELAK